MLHQLVLRTADRMDQHVRSDTIAALFTERSWHQDVITIGIDRLPAIQVLPEADVSSREHRSSDNCCRDWNGILSARLCYIFV
jgi:hypothetical protein